MRTKNRRIFNWVKRYLPGEIIGTVAALSSAVFVYNVTHSYAIAGIAGMIGENLGYYGYFLSLETTKQYKKHRKHPPLQRTWLVTSHTTKRLLLEFGVAEIMDSFIIRPYFMSIAPQYIAPYWLGALAGKIIADVIFYSLAIIGYEYESIRKRARTMPSYLKNKWTKIFTSNNQSSL